MLRIKHILYPFDFSNRCSTAVPFVEAIAIHFGAKVTLLSVAQPFLFTAMGDLSTPVYIAPEDVMHELKAKLEVALASEFKGLNVDRVPKLGEPAEMIIDFARANDVDLIMMPTHGWGSFRRLLLGSVAAKVLHDAECPVWTAAHMEESVAREYVPRRILCAVDGTSKGVALMQWAGRFARHTGAKLDLIHLIPGMEGLPSAQMDREFEQDLRKKALEEITKQQASAGLDASLCVSIGHVAEGVREEALRCNADMILIGRGVLHETLGRLRTHSYGIIRHSPCPVLSV